MSRDDTPEETAIDALIVLSISDLTPDERERLFRDGITPEQDRASRLAELERIFGPGWQEDVQRTIEEMDAAGEETIR